MGEYSINPSLTTNGGGTWGSILKMTASLNGTNITFTVNKQSGTFTTTSTIYLKVGTYEPNGVNRANGSIQAEGSSWFNTYNLSSYPEYPKNFYFRIENSSGFAWVGPITVSPLPAVTSVSPTTTRLNQLTTFTISGSDLTSGMGFWIADCANVTEVPRGNSTSRQFSCTPSNTPGQKSVVVKDTPNGNTLYNFAMTVNPSDFYRHVSPADTITRLLDDKITESKVDSNGNPKIPLIIIHGVHGTEDIDKNGSLEYSEIFATENYFYWDKFKANFYNNSLNNQYKLYQFNYISDIKSVSDIASSLRNKIDDAINCENGFSCFETDNVDKYGPFVTKMKDVPIVIVAHSMGGLVARSYMSEQFSNTGHYKGKWAGERVLKLITLATPHHGSPLANNEPRFNAILDPKWDIEAKLLDKAVWGKTLLTHPEKVNRSDLRWDNFDFLWGTEYEDQVYEKNDWLRSLNGLNRRGDGSCCIASYEKYANKIIAYWGYLGNSETIERLGAIKNPSEYLYSLAIDKLSISSIFLERIMRKDTTIDIKEVFNDGVVTKGSASFEGHVLAKKVGCRSYNHSDMKDGKTEKCDNTKTLFNSITDDLNTISDTTIPTGSININSDAAYTKSTAITLNLSASDSVGVAGYYVSESLTTPLASATGWIVITPTTRYSANVNYTLSSGDGTKIVSVWYKDTAGNVSMTYNDFITLNSTAPANGSLIATAKNMVVILDWVGLILF